MRALLQELLQEPKITKNTFQRGGTDLLSLPNDLLLFLLRNFLNSGNLQLLQLVSKRLNALATFVLKERRILLEQRFGEKAVNVYRSIAIAERELPRAVKQAARAAIDYIRNTNQDEGDDDFSRFQLPWGEIITDDDEDMIYLYYGQFLELLEHLRPSDVVDEMINLWKSKYSAKQNITALEITQCITQELTKSGCFWQTFLHLFAITGDSAAIIKLIEAGADINARDIWGSSPLFLLFTPYQTGRIPPSIELLTFLHAHGARLDEENLNEQIIHYGLFYYRNRKDDPLFPEYVAAFTFCFVKGYITDTHFQFQVLDDFLDTSCCAAALAALFFKGYITQSEYGKTINTYFTLLHQSLSDLLSFDVLTSRPAHLIAYMKSFHFLYQNNKITPSDRNTWVVTCVSMLSQYLLKLPVGIFSYWIPKEMEKPYYQYYVGIRDFLDALLSYPFDTHPEMLKYLVQEKVISRCLDIVNSFSVPGPHAPVITSQTSQKEYCETVKSQLEALQTLFDSQENVVDVDPPRLGNVL